MDEISYEQAREIAIIEKNKDFKSQSGSVVLPNKYVETRSDGWLFYPVSRDYEQTENPKYALLGAGAYFVRKDGSLVVVPSYVFIPDRLDEYLKTH